MYAPDLKFVVGFVGNGGGALHHRFDHSVSIPRNQFFDMHLVQRITNHI